MITSYSIPAQASFTCPPCSVRLRREKNTSRRLTFCSLADPKPRIQCFAETFGKNPGNHEKISIASHDLSHTNTPVIFLNTFELSRTENEDPDTVLLVVHEDGAIRCLSGNLSEELWKSESASRTDTFPKRQTRVLCAAMLDIDEARKGFLRNREDILAKFQEFALGSDNDAGVSDLLVILAQTMVPNTESASNTVELRLYSIQANYTPLKKLAQGPRHSALELLVAFPIPNDDVPKSDRSSYFIHAASGTLYHSSGKSLWLYDFTSPIPRLAQHIQLKNRVQSCLRRSSSSVVLATSTYIAIVDNQYKAVLSEMPLEPSPEDSGATSSFKHSARKGNTRLLSYFNSLGTVVAVQGRNLMSYQVFDPNSAYIGGHKRARNGRLVDAIGRGIRNSSSKSSAPKKDGSIPETFGQIITEATIDRRWEEVTPQLDVLASEGNAEEFDALVVEKFLVEECESKETMHKRPNESIAPKRRHPRSMLFYFIGVVFNVKNEGKSNTSILQSSLSIAFLPRKVFHWLVANDCFSSQYIESALKQIGKLKPLARLQPCTMINALVQYDKSLRTLLSLLEMRSFFTAKELVFAMRMGIENLQIQDSLQDQKLLEQGEVNGLVKSDADMELVNGHSESDPEPHLITEKSSNFHQVIKQSLIRLHNCHESEIRAALRAELPQPILLSFVDFLRMDLAQGGWLSRYVEGEESETARSQANASINVVTKLFNCAIDCLGTGGWISGALNSVMADNLDTIAYMKAEVSAALEGIEEAAYLKSMLNEVLLYSRTIQTRPAESQPEESGVVRPITVAVKTWEDNVLPLGLKASQGPSLTKIGAGGEIQERSMRDVGRLKSRKVGAYSFERIII